MNIANTRIARQLGTDLPIIQGPFGGGLSTVRLAAAVSNAGGLGSFGAHLLAPEEILQLGRNLSAATLRPFAMNLWVSRYDPGFQKMPEPLYALAVERFSGLCRRYGIPMPLPPEPDAFTFEEQAAAVLEARPRVFSFVFGIPGADILENCRRQGILTLGAATTPAEAMALEAAGVDLILATGFEAGGHRPSFLRRAEDSLLGTLPLVAQVRDSVKGPVIAAGGIVEARGAAAAFALGADAVQLGTAFLACEESGTSQFHKDTLFSPAAAVTRLSRAMSGRLARFIVCEMLDELETLGSLPFPWQGWFTKYVRTRLRETEQPDELPLYAGQGAPLLRHRQAAAVVQHLANGLATGS